MFWPVRTAAVRGAVIARSSPIATACNSIGICVGTVHGRGLEADVSADSHPAPSTDPDAARQAVLLTASRRPRVVSCWSTASRPGSRRRGQCRPHIAAVRARRRPSRRGKPHRDVHARPVAVGALGLPDGNRIEHQVLVPRGQAATVLSWRPRAGPAGPGGTSLVSAGTTTRPSREPAFRFDEVAGRRVVWVPIRAFPRSWRARNGSYAHQPDWYRNFPHRGAARGLDCVEDLASPASSLGLGERRGGPDPRGGGARARDDVEAIRVAEGEHRRRFASRSAPRMRTWHRGAARR
jgi:hypothetical protein